jgi:esterase/lipase superfamily enzyme
MSRFRRRVAGGLGLLALLLIAIAGWVYHGIYGSTGVAIQRAEAFAFRRMRAAQVNEQGAFRSFFVTNRSLASGEAALVDRFETTRDDELRFGSFDTKIEPAVGLGMLIDPSQWFQDEEIQLEAVQPLDRAAVAEQLCSLVESSRHRSLLVVVHGYREGFQSALRKTAFLGHVLDIDSPLLVFDWPGNQGGSLAGYRRAREVAEASGADLAATLQWIVREVAPERLWLLANSMGGQVVVDAFDLLHREPDWQDAAPELEDVVLTAPDVDAEDFDEGFKAQLKAFAQNLTVYVSSNDRALVLSRWVNRGRRRGESTLSPDQLEEAMSVSELIEPGDERVALVDVTPVNRTRNFHNFSLETPEFFDDLFLRLLNESTPRTRRAYQLQTPEGAVYWVLTRGR